MKLLILASIIVLYLIGIVGVQESFAEKTWYLGEGIKKGDFFSYSVCHHSYKDCTPFEIHLLVLEVNDSFIDVNFTVIENGNSIDDIIIIDTETWKTSKYSEFIKPYVEIFEEGITSWSNIASQENPKTFDEVWFKSSNIGGMDVKPGSLNSMEIDGMMFDTVNLRWSGSSDGHLLIADEFPFPINSELSISVYSGNKSKIYDFKLLPSTPSIGSTWWLEAVYPSSGAGVVRIIDSDMNLDPNYADNFIVKVWSDSDAKGIDLTVTETNDVTGIFEGTVFFTTVDESFDHMLRVAEGDTITAIYEDKTLPDPYTTEDELDITATSIIGTIVPYTHHYPVYNLRIVDEFGNSFGTVFVDQPVHISSDLANGKDVKQEYVYFVQIINYDGMTVSLKWITGVLDSGQSFSPALSWIPTSSGTYIATAFVWDDMNDPSPLSPPTSTTFAVN